MSGSTIVQVYCPKYGAEMTLADGTFTCVPGDMPLSLRMHERLVRSFEHLHRDAPEPQPIEPGRWFCSGCGVRMTRNETQVRCDTCGKALDEFIHELVELHPHLTRLLLTVEDTFAITGRGRVLAPFLPASEARSGRISVELHRPHGSVICADALVQVPFVHPTPPEPKAHVVLLEVGKDQVPVGTRVWVR